MQHTGCEVLQRLWDMAQADLAVGDPGYVGVPARAQSFIESGNMLWAMQLSALKCWEERSALLLRSKGATAIPLPPLTTSPKTKAVSATTPSMLKSEAAHK